MHLEGIVALFAESLDPPALTIHCHYCHPYCHCIVIALPSCCQPYCYHVLTIYCKSYPPPLPNIFINAYISCLVFLKNHVQRNQFVLVIIFVELLLIYHSTTGPQAPINYFQLVLDSVSTCRYERGKFCGCLDIAVQGPWTLINVPIQQI